MKNKLEELCRDFIDVLEIVEESDSGREFHPNTISSCRSLDIVKMDKILEDIKKEINYE